MAKPAKKKLDKEVNVLIDKLLLLEKKLEEIEIEESKLREKEEELLSQRTDLRADLSGHLSKLLPDSGIRELAFSRGKDAVLVTVGGHVRVVKVIK